jgi:hypothetical protein
MSLRLWLAESHRCSSLNGLDDKPEAARSKGWLQGIGREITHGPCRTSVPEGACHCQSRRGSQARSLGLSPPDSRDGVGVHPDFSATKLGTVEHLLWYSGRPQLVNAGTSSSFPAAKVPPSLSG